MTHQHPDLVLLGWNEWLAQRAQCHVPHTLARVAVVDRDQLWLLDAGGLFRGRLSGSFMHHHTLAQELPCVGDWVCVEKPPGDGIAVVHELIQRKTALFRKAAGNTHEIQMIAANVDHAVIVQSCHVDFNLNRLERYLVMVSEGGAEPFILLTKTDLVAPDIVETYLAQIRASGIQAPVMALNNMSSEGVGAFSHALQAGKTYCFIGSSGVGKSTLINRLIGREAQLTSSVSGTGEGRHTTVRRELIQLENGALVIDSPGMREFGVLGSGEGLDNNFADISALASACRFRDCSHAQEPGCAVRQAVEKGEISRPHYQNYLKLKQETGFHDLSYAEKRKRDKDFGKMVKSGKKGFNNK